MLVRLRSWLGMYETGGDIWEQYTTAAGLATGVAASMRMRSASWSASEVGCCIGGVVIPDVRSEEEAKGGVFVLDLDLNDF